MTKEEFLKQLDEKLKENALHGINHKYEKC